MMEIARRKITFIIDEKEVWVINEIHVASKMEIPSKNGGFITLPSDKVGKNNRFWVKRIDMEYIEDDGIIYSELTIQIEEA